SQAAGKEIGADQERHILRRKLERTAEDQRYRNRARIHDQHMLQTEREKPGDRQDLIDRVNVAGHRPPPPSNCSRRATFSARANLPATNVHSVQSQGGLVLDRIVATTIKTMPGAIRRNWIRFTGSSSGTNARVIGDTYFFRCCCRKASERSQASFADAS